MSDANHRRSVPYPYNLRLSAMVAGGSISITRRSAPAADKYYFTRNSAPAAGSTYLIVEKSTGQALAFSHGELILATVPGLSSYPYTSDPVQAGTFAGTCNRHCLWHCKESEGWLGFQNAVTAHGGWLGQAAREPVLTSDGRFCVKKEECGDNYLLTKKFIVEGKAVMECAQFERYALDRGRLVHWKISGSENTGETTWEFVKVTVVPKAN
ncbi:hypothetical protein B0H65DRAFT_468690 [Neurospora tetraspora]|uniref:Uncharacterized protein n=1 Tax=Neurospora tetraspora TaxID=94610 RepID=A0AAE0JCD7_9PEZI|nr:hypothetical protein B0H65DRAFT_468690 [Neurospora tetraspora]